jgi:K+-sensing histidine kinase KdpD
MALQLMPAQSLPRGPWFRDRPAATILVTAASYLAVFALRITVGDATDTISMLYALPVALVAVAFGRRAGTVAGAISVALIAVWTLVDGVTLSGIGWVTRSLPLLLLGYLLGDAVDRFRRVEAERRALEAAAQRHRDAVEINDTIVQGMSSAKWALEMGDADAGLQRLSETITVSRRLVSDLLRDGGLSPTGPRTADRRFSELSNEAAQRAS